MECVWVYYPQVADSVTLSQCDLKYFQDAEKSSQPTQTLFPATTYSNQQGIPHRRLKNTTYPTATHQHRHTNKASFAACSTKKVQSKFKNEISQQRRCLTFRIHVF